VGGQQGYDATGAGSAMKFQGDNISKNGVPVRPRAFIPGRDRAFQQFVGLQGNRAITTGGADDLGGQWPVQVRTNTPLDDRRIELKQALASNPKFLGHTFVDSADLDYMQEQEVAQFQAAFDNWYGKQYDPRSPAEVMLAQQRNPEYFSRRDSEFIGRLQQVLQWYRINLRGSLTPEDDVFMYAIDTGAVDGQALKAAAQALVAPGPGTESMDRGMWNPFRTKRSGPRNGAMRHLEGPIHRGGAGRLANAKNFNPVQQLQSFVGSRAQGGFDEADLTQR